MPEAYRSVPLSPVRKMIAARMSHAKQTIPHFRMTAQVGADALIKLRQRINAEYPETRVSLNDLLVKASATALVDVPQLNVQWADSEIRLFPSADISVVTATPTGPTTPIIRGAQAKSILAIASELRILIDRAARNSLAIDEIMGGSFTVSNLGMYGVEAFDAIINPPQCAILAIGAARPALIVGPNGEPAACMAMQLTLSVDHRAVDGAIAAQFMESLRERIEVPTYMQATGS